ncbi:unnamed protein product [Phytophthora fragariaefolia]|uniref:Unnamed protein product n=1 Tax=Phytophthora fragariaefolia TaxID=1490495 RepID=A0A9W6XU43_9STRA|nr:unnamed protein product [Phytophthora fragariaefolia]
MQSPLTPERVDARAEAEPEPQLEEAASPADAAKNKKKKKKKNKKSRRKSLERAPSELEVGAQAAEPEHEQEDKPSLEEAAAASGEEAAGSSIEEAAGASIEEAAGASIEEKAVVVEPSNEEPAVHGGGSSIEEEEEPCNKVKAEQEEDNQAGDGLGPPELERKSSLDSMKLDAIKASGSRAVGSLLSRFKVGRKKPLPSRTESAANLELVSPSPVKTAVKHLEVHEEKSLDDLPLRTKRDFFGDGEQSVRVSAQKEKYDTLEKQWAKVKEAEAAKQSPLSSTKSNEQVQIHVEAMEGKLVAEACDEEQVGISSDAPTSLSPEAVEKENSPGVVNDVEANEVEANDAEVISATTNSFTSSVESPAPLQKSTTETYGTSDENLVLTEATSSEMTAAHMTASSTTSSMVLITTDERMQRIDHDAATKNTQPVSIKLDLDFQPSENTTEATQNQEEAVASLPPERLSTTLDVAESVSTNQSAGAEVLQVKVSPPMSELPSETRKPNEPEKMSPVKSLASRFEGKREQSLDSLKFRTVREFFPEERSIRVGAEKQKYEAQAQQQKLKAKAEEEVKSKYKIGSSFKSAALSPAPSPEIKATLVKESVESFNLSTPDSAGTRKKFSLDEGFTAANSPGNSSDNAPESLTPVKSIASRFEGKHDQSLDSLKFRTVREFFPEERSVRVGSEKQKFEAQAHQDKSLDNLKFRTVREFFPDDGKRSIHVGAEKAKFEALTKQQEEAAKAAEQLKQKHGAFSPLAEPEGAKVDTSHDASFTANDRNQIDTGASASKPQENDATEPAIEFEVEEGGSCDVIPDVEEISLAMTDEPPVNIPENSSEELATSHQVSQRETFSDENVEVVEMRQASIQRDIDGSIKDANEAEKLTSADRNALEQTVDLGAAVYDNALAVLNTEEAIRHSMDQTHLNESVAEQDVEVIVSNTDNGVSALNTKESHELRKDPVTIDGSTSGHKIESDIATSAGERIVMGVEGSAQLKENGSRTDEHLTVQEIVNAESSAENEIAPMNASELIQLGQNQTADKTTLELEAENESSPVKASVVADDNKSISHQESQATEDSAVIEHLNERGVSSADESLAESNTQGPVSKEAEVIDASTGGVGSIIEIMPESVEAIEEVQNEQGGVEVVDQGTAIASEETKTAHVELTAEVEQKQEPVEMVEKNDCVSELVELNLSVPGKGQHVSQLASGDIENASSSSEIQKSATQQLDQDLITANTSQSERAEGVPRAKHELFEVDLGKPASVKLEDELVEGIESKQRPMLMTERSFVMEDNSTIETQDTVVVGERPMTDGEDEFEPLPGTKTSPKQKLKQDSTSFSKGSAHISKVSPKLTRKISAGSVGSTKSQHAKTTVSSPMKRASITAPTASCMAKKVAEDKVLHKSSRKLKTHGSASKLPATPTVPVPMKRGSITAPTASYMARKAAEAEEGHRLSSSAKNQTSKHINNVGSAGSAKSTPVTTTVPVPMKRASITAPTASWQARKSKTEARESQSSSKGTSGPAVPVAPKRASIMAPTASYVAKKAVEQTKDIGIAESTAPGQNKRFSNVKSKVLEGIQSGSMHAATYKKITKEDFIAAERRKSLGSAGVRSVLDASDRRASLTARATIDGPPEPFVRSALSRKKLNSTVPRYLDYENTRGYAERAQKQYERRKRLEEENAAKTERRQRELRVFFSEQQQKALKLSAEEVRRGLEAHEFARLAKESEIEAQKALRRDKQRARSATHTAHRASLSASSVGASSSNEVVSRASRKSSVLSFEEKASAVKETNAAVDSTVLVKETIENGGLPNEEPAALTESSYEEEISTEVQEIGVEATACAVNVDATLDEVAKKIDFDEASSDSDEKGVHNK